MGNGAAAIENDGNLTATRSKRRALIEIAVAYGLIMSVIWTARPLQRLLWLVAVGTVAVITWRSWDGLKAVGLRRENFFRSLWVVGAALAIAAMAVLVAIHLHTLGLPDPPATGPGSSDDFSGGFMLFVRTYWGYALWTFVQQFLMQGFFLLRLLRLLPGPRSAAFAAAGLFALAHLPNPILAPVTLIWGFAACLIFLRYRNLYPLAMAHAIFGITIAITIPGPVVHNMRVGLGYLTYGHRHSHAQLLQPQGPDRVH
jgi:Type II CAAX prenyl endopeptidase Rce1-like